MLAGPAFVHYFAGLKMDGLRYFLILMGIAFLTGSCSSMKSASRSAVASSGSGQHKGDSKFLHDISISAGGSSGASRREADIPHLPEDHKLSGSYMFPPFNIEQGNSLQFKYAIKMDVEVERLKNTHLYDFIESWWGAPYRMGGSTQKGVDCSAFTQMAMSVIYGLHIPRTAREQKVFCNEISKEELREGDLVFFNTRGRGITHVGIYLQDNKFVHAASSGGVMISSLNENYWQRKWICAGRAVDDKTAAAVSLSGR
ncbi:MAG: C40 family peptidase [Chitinophagaceae bacterium]|nr:C40 family peptidase [Chitinophagaceae bacterium]